MREPIGLLGMGLLGGAVAERLLERGWTVVGFDPAPERRAAMKTAGVAIAARPDIVLASCQRVILCLPNDQIVANTLRPLIEKMPVEPMPAGQIILDMTTGSPAQRVEMEALLQTRNVVYLDAPVAGSSRQARSGKAVVLVGGQQAAYEQCRELLLCIAEHVEHVGPCGAAAQAKLVHNLVLGLNRAVLAEGLAFAQAMGLDLQTMLAFLRRSPAYSQVMDAKGDKMATADFTPQARLSQHLKDVRLILQAAEALPAKTPLSALHRRLLEQAEAAGWGDADNSAIIKVFEPGEPPTSYE